MRVVFAGTPEFAVPALDALADAGHQIAAVLTQPDRPAGRGLAATPGPVKAVAGKRALVVLQPVTLNEAAVQARLRTLAPDVVVAAAYGLILPQAVLDIPRLGAINIHASLLPRWRGAAPIQRALLAGDQETGVCIMRMEAGLDTGPVLLREAVPIMPRDDAGTLHDKLAGLGARLVTAALAGLARGTLHPTPQPSAGVTYAEKIAKHEGRVRWARRATEIDRQVRAFNPFPGATARLHGADVKLWQARVVDLAGEPGRVLAVDRTGIVVACGEGALRLEALQRAGGKRLSASAFLHGNPVAAGERFESLDTDGNG